ncbi:MAG: type I-E CRISPR-associated protein Cas7/Cse4/CasC [Gammaproteobacteria bacterium]|nr:type I-E CRISPR-associated protein Cas7/Cse4/CasC [Gammaproteobacteria bacterium]
MSRFLQLHMLTSYPPSNLNRDDLGRPKTARMGGTERLRVSSQSLKRNWRVSDIFQAALGQHLGTRTKRLGLEVYQDLITNGVSEKNAKTWAQSIASQFGKLKGSDSANPLADLEIEQLVHVSPIERKAVDHLVSTITLEKRPPGEGELNLLRADDMAADIALFGRMLASKPGFNVEAACQVAHAISVHSVVIEDDYFTAVDDLNTHEEDAGAAHIGETGFAAGLFYSYICINRELLIDNLNGDTALASKAIQALIETAMKIAPKGKQNSFGSLAYASYARAEKGNQQPRSLSVAFLKAVDKNSEDFAATAIESLERHAANFDKVYGACADETYSVNVFTGEGSLEALIAFAGK